MTYIDRSDEERELAAEDQRRERASRNGQAPDDAEKALPGGIFLFGSEYEDGPALWGDGPNVLWSPGESLMVAAPQGLGKTTLGGQLVRALLGLDDSVFGLPVTPTDKRILYLAMDRPRQIRRSLRRQFTESDAELLNRRLVVRPGPPDADLAAHPLLLRGMAEHYDAGIVFVDSLKDAALGLSSDETGSAWNRARQHLLASDREMCEFHHCRKPSGGDQKRKLTIDDIYGSAWLTNGCGSVILLAGEPGDPIIDFRHVKQPWDEVGPFTLQVDHDAGRMLSTARSTCSH